MGWSSSQIIAHANRSSRCSKSRRNTHCDVTDGRWVEAAIEEVQIGNELLVKPGELFPVDGVMIEGATSADESALTGEAIPVVKQIGDAVSGGTLNLDGQSVIPRRAGWGRAHLAGFLT
ncbi:MAG: hypothetical protein DMF08_06440 [Verrucomicrobia bacterium]|nr:MAG: hypothetical protein DMF08_06440 [Verrucomicrobiota bacterium]PYL12992.1 MAG: hypothetical protein DMF48_01110 [Verrucomicrobiota bacterium]